MTRACLALALYLVVTPWAAADSLTFFTWEDFISEELLAEWERETGVEVKQVFYDSDEMRDEVLASGGARIFDLVIFDSVSSRVIGEHQLIAPVTDENVPNRKHIDARWDKSCKKYGVPYLWGTVGIVYQIDKFATPPSSWGDILFPEPEHRGHIVMHQDAVETLIPPLILMNSDFDSEEKGELQRAYKLLQQQLPHVLSYDYILTYARDKQKRDNVHMALAYSGDQHTLMEMSGGDDWGFVVPKEGTGVWVDCIAVMRESNKQDVAFRFIDFITDPANAARNASDLYVATPNVTAMALLDEDFLNDADVFPGAELLGKSKTYAIQSGGNMILRNRIVNSVVRKHEAQ